MTRYAKHVGPVCENAAMQRDAPRAPSPADIQSPALLLPHKAARAAPTAGGTREKFRGAVITRDWLPCVVIDRFSSPTLL